MAKVILAGGSGFLGQALGQALAAEGWEVVVLSRDPREGAFFREVLWNGETGGAWLTRHLKPESATIYAASLLPRLQAESVWGRAPPVRFLRDGTCLWWTRMT